MEADEQVAKVGEALLRMPAQVGDISLHLLILQEQSALWIERCRAVLETAAARMHALHGNTNADVYGGLSSLLREMRSQLIAADEVATVLNRCEDVSSRVRSTVASFRMMLTALLHDTEAIAREAADGGEMT